MLKNTYAIIFILFIFSCNGERAVSTEEMVKILQTLEKKAFSSPSYPYANQLRVDKLLPVNNSIPYTAYWSDRLIFIDELIASGATEDAIAVARNSIDGLFPEDKITLRSKPYYESLALAYLRLGEQVNCLTNHSSSSCIIPIESPGFHSDTTGSYHASVIYEKLIEFDSTDFESRWLYNIAMMTLGKYPNDVKEKYLIPAASFNSDISFPRFKDVANQKNIHVTGHAGGSIMEDFNNDGKMDLFMTSYLLGDQARLLIQQEDGTFDDITIEAGLEGITGGLNTLQADYNNDGYVDILILRGGWLRQFGQIPNSLLKNNGDGTFIDTTIPSGLLSYHPSQTATWADFNLDGHVDLFIGNETTFQSIHPSELFINNGDGTFTEMAESVGLDIRAYIKGTVSGDFNNDGYPDLYVSVLGGKNRMFMNRPKGAKDARKLVFEDIAVDLPISEPINSFPVLLSDFNNDGWQDLLISGYYGENPDEVAKEVSLEYLGFATTTEKPRMFVNQGNEISIDKSKEFGIDKTLYTMGANVGDINNDGWQDIYFGTGEFNLKAIIPNKMYINEDGKVLRDVTTAGGFGQIQKGHGISFGDIDMDGDQDIFTVIGGALQADVYRNMLYENPGNQNNWLTIQLAGTSSNKSAIGARIEVQVEGLHGNRIIHRTVHSGGSFGANSLQLEIGLGQGYKINAVKVKWPNAHNSVETWSDLSINRNYMLVEGQGVLTNTNDMQD